MLIILKTKENYKTPHEYAVSDDLVVVVSLSKKSNVLEWVRPIAITIKTR